MRHSMIIQIRTCRKTFATNFTRMWLDDRRSIVRLINDCTRLLSLHYVFDNVYSMTTKSRRPFHTLDIHVVFHLYVFVYVDWVATDDRTFSRRHHTSKIYVFVDCYYSFHPPAIDCNWRKRRLSRHLHWHRFQSIFSFVEQVNCQWEML